MLTVVQNDSLVSREFRAPDGKIDSNKACDFLATTCKQILDTLKLEFPAEIKVITDEGKADIAIKSAGQQLVNVLNQLIDTPIASEGWDKINDSHDAILELQSKIGSMHLEPGDPRAALNLAVSRIALNDTVNQLDGAISIAFKATPWGEFKKTFLQLCEALNETRAASLARLENLNDLSEMLRSGDKVEITVALKAMALLMKDADSKANQQTRLFNCLYNGERSNSEFFSASESIHWQVAALASSNREAIAKTVQELVASQDTEVKDQAIEALKSYGPEGLSQLTAAYKLDYIDVHQFTQVLEHFVAYPGALSHRGSYDGNITNYANYAVNTALQAIKQISQEDNASALRLAVAATELAPKDVNRKVSADFSDGLISALSDRAVETSYARIIQAHGVVLPEIK